MDPLYSANEGKAVFIVSEKAANGFLSEIRKHEYGADAEIIGTVVENDLPLVWVKNALGASRILPMPTGTQFPRIC